MSPSLNRKGSEMNKERLLKVADILEKARHVNPREMRTLPSEKKKAGEELYFNMMFFSKRRSFIYNNEVLCGTICCIAGYAAEQARLDRDYQPDPLVIQCSTVSSIATDYFEFEKPSVAHTLFCPCHINMDKVLPIHAADMLRWMVEQDEEPSKDAIGYTCLLYTSPSPRDRQKSRMPSSA